MHDTLGHYHVKIARDNAPLFGDRNITSVLICVKSWEVEQSGTYRAYLIPSIDQAKSSLTFGNPR